MAVKQIPLEVIRIDGETQPREKINQDTVAEYKERIEAGDKFPPLTIYFDGKMHWLADGFHRYHALRQLNRDQIDVELIKGTLEEAQWYAAGANRGHGLQRSNADKRHAVREALRLRPGASDREIAKHCGVHHDMVATCRTQAEPNPRAKVADSAKTDDKPLPANDNQILEKMSQAEAFVTEKKAAGWPDSRILIIAKTKGPEFRAEVESILKGEDDGPPMDTEEPEESPKPKKATEPMKDKVGNVLPNHLVADFGRTDEIQELMTVLSKMKQEVGKRVKGDDPLYRGLNWQRFEADMEQAYNALRHTKPYAVCPYCWAKDIGGCQACKGRGWVGEGVYKAAPRENK